MDVMERLLTGRLLSIYDAEDVVLRELRQRDAEFSPLGYQLHKYEKALLSELETYIVSPFAPDVHKKAI